MRSGQGKVGGDFLHSTIISYPGRRFFSLPFDDFQAFFYCLPDLLATHLPQFFREFPVLRSAEGSNSCQFNQLFSSFPAVFILFFILYVFFVKFILIMASNSKLFFNKGRILAQFLLKTGRLPLSPSHKRPIVAHLYSLDPMTLVTPWYAMYVTSVPSSNSPIRFLGILASWTP